MLAVFSHPLVHVPGNGFQEGLYPLAGVRNVNSLSACLYCNSMVLKHKSRELVKSGLLSMKNLKPDFWPGIVTYLPK